MFLRIIYGEVADGVVNIEEITLLARSRRALCEIGGRRPTLNTSMLRKALAG